jgi:uncharacterized protein YqjF (DUF2071 family)
VIENPLLANLPFKMELNKFYKLLISPASDVVVNLNILLAVVKKGNNGGVIIMECSIDTAYGVKVADIAWTSYQK